MGSVGGIDSRTITTKTNQHPAEKKGINTTDSFKRSDANGENLIDPKKMTNLNTGKAASVLGKTFAREVKKVREVDIGKSSGPDNFSPVLRKDGIYINANGYTRKFDYDGNEKWSVETGCSGHSKPSFDRKGNVYLVGGEKLHSIDPDGKKRWETPIGKKGCSHSPVIAPDGTIYLVTEDRHVKAFGKDGKLKWKRHQDSLISKEPFLDKNGRI